MNFRWTPTEEIEEGVIEQMRQHFPRPDYPMRVAWFMGEEITYFDELMLEQPEDLGYKYIDSALREITSGISSFGRLEEWVIWFRHLLPEMLIWNGEWRSNLLEATLTAFINVYWKGIEEEYPEFREDVFNSLAKLIATPFSWSNLQRFPLLIGGYIWQVDGFMSVSLFFCLKFLKVEEIRGWVTSLVAIEDVRWRLQFIIWLSRAKLFFEDDSYTHRKPLFDNLFKHTINWNNAEFLSRVDKSLSEFVSAENQQEFWNALRAKLSKEMFLSWMDDFYAQEPVLAKQFDEWLIFDQLFDETLS